MNEELRKMPVIIRKPVYGTGRHHKSVISCYLNPDVLVEEQRHAMYRSRILVS